MPEFSKYLLDIDRDYRETGEWGWGKRLIEVDLCVGAEDATWSSLGERPTDDGSSPAPKHTGGQPE